MAQSKKRKSAAKADKSKKPNILLIMADEYRFPRYFKDPNAGMRPGIKDILGFQGNDKSIADYAKYFPGLVKLRENAVVLKNHTIASSACVPSRAAMFTGQYGTRTGVTQTDGILKSGESLTFKWLEPDGVPTMGDWLRADGYQTHYFGKCHFAHPPDHSLQEFGFNDWEKSYPEPHGSFKNNLGFYRDHGFSDLVGTFLHGKGLALGYDREEAEGLPKLGSDEEQKPWFAVASFTNPHDITTYPMLPGMVDPDYDLAPQKGKIKQVPLPIPTAGMKSTPPEKGTWQLDLNPDGFKQDSANLPPTWNEDLRNNNKPDCQYEYSIKLGLAIASGLESPPVASHAGGILGIPFQLTDDPEAWSRNYIQYYTYLHYQLDQHIDRIMKTLDETGLRENTIVIFAPDHGEYGSSHGMMAQKWHSAYQEAIHVPVVVSLPQGEKQGKAGKNNAANMTQVEDLTSHIDLLPTLLGLAGIDKKRRAEIRKELQVNHVVPKLVGSDLSSRIKLADKDPVKELDGKAREGILFVTDDMITEPGPGEEGSENNQIFLETVETYKNNPNWEKWTASLENGAVCQPSHVMCVRQKHWKLVKYFDPSRKYEDQWEMYNLNDDPEENINLLQYDGAFPTAMSSKKVQQKRIETKAKSLQKLMNRLAKRMLTPEE